MHIGAAPVPAPSTASMSSSVGSLHSSCLFFLAECYTCAVQAWSSKIGGALPSKTGTVRVVVLA